jgi:hypothetical protein
MGDLDLHTRELLLDFVASAEPLDAMRRGVTALAWRLDSDDVVAQNPITAQASLWLAEHSSGHRSDTELRELLADLLENVTIVYAPPGVERVSGTSTTPTRPVQLAQLVGAGR